MQDPHGGARYWDPVSYVGVVLDSLLVPDVRPASESVFCGKWEERNWRNVPGPFYGAMTDNCWVGRQSAAPAHPVWRRH